MIREKKYLKFVLVVSFALMSTVIFMLGKKPSLSNERFLVANHQCGYNFSLDKPENSFIKIKNKQDQATSISFALNQKKFYQDINDVLREIKGKEEVVSQKKIFDFVSKVSSHYYPLTGENWYHSPLLFINSLGFGFCDDVARVLRDLSLLAGKNARLISLGGHLVTELESEKKEWMMFDPDYGVFFEDDNGKVLGVSDLSEKPFFMTEPRQKIEFKINPIDPTLSPYTKDYSDLFSSFEDNIIIEELDSDYKIMGNTFLIPGQGSIIFPVQVLPKPIAVENKKVKKYQNLQLVLPAGYTGEVNNFLVIHSIEGKGRIAINKKKMSIKEFTENHNHDEFIESLEIIESNSDININYFLNPNIFGLQMHNSLKIEGEDCELLDIYLGER